MTDYPRTPPPDGITGADWSSPYTRLTYATLSDLSSTLPLHDATALTNLTAQTLNNYNNSLDPAGIRLEQFIADRLADMLVLEARSGGPMIIPADSIRTQVLAAKEIARKLADHLAHSLINVIDYAPSNPDDKLWRKSAT